MRWLAPFALVGLVVGCDTGVDVAPPVAEEPAPANDAGQVQSAPQVPASSSGGEKVDASGSTPGALESSPITEALGRDPTILDTAPVAPGAQTDATDDDSGGDDPAADDAASDQGAGNGGQEGSTDGGLAPDDPPAEDPPVDGEPEPLESPRPDDGPPDAGGAPPPGIPESDPDVSAPLCEDCLLIHEAEPAVASMAKAPGCADYPVATVSRFLVTRELLENYSRLLIHYADVLPGSRQRLYDTALAQDDELPSWVTVNVASLGVLPLELDTTFVGPASAAATVLTYLTGDECPAAALPFEIYLSQ